MNRRKFLTTAAVGGTAAAAASTFPAPAISQGRVKLTMVTSWGSRFCRRVPTPRNVWPTPINAMSDGSMEIELKAGGRACRPLRGVRRSVLGTGRHLPLGRLLFPRPASRLRLLHRGAVRHDRPGAEQLVLPHGRPRAAGRAHRGVQPEVAFRPATPAAQCRRLVPQGDHRPRGFPGPQVPHAGSRAARRSDISGRRFRTFPGGEVYQALSSGAIDGTEWIGPWADEKAGFYEVTKIYYTAGFHEPGSGLSLSLNREVYDGLSASAAEDHRGRGGRGQRLEPRPVPRQQRCRAAAPDRRGRADQGVPGLGLGCVRWGRPAGLRREHGATPCSRRSTIRSAIPWPSRRPGLPSPIPPTPPSATACSGSSNLPVPGIAAMPGAPLSDGAVDRGA